jgi:hypothetical protein
MIARSPSTQRIAGDTRCPPRIVVLDMDFEREPDLWRAGRGRLQRATTVVPVITRCSCSISLTMWSDARFCTAPTVGRAVLDPVVARYRT